MRELTRKEILIYEVHSSRIAAFIGFAFGQRILGSYFAWKVRKKYNRYLLSIKERERVLNDISSC